MTISLRDNDAIKTHKVLWVIHSEMVESWNNYNTVRTGTNSAPLDLSDFSISIATAFDKWCRRADDWHINLTRETYAEHVTFSNYMLATQYGDDVHQYAITSRWPWTILLPHTDTISSQSMYFEFVCNLILDTTFVNEKRAIVGPYLTARLLENIRERLETNSVGLLPIILWRLFLRFAYQKSAFDAQIWLKKKDIRRRIVVLLVKITKRNNRCRQITMFLKEHPAWNRLYKSILSG